MISMLLHATLILRFDPPMILTIHFNHQAVLTVNSKRPQRDFRLPPLILDPPTDIQVIFEWLGSVLNVQHGRLERIRGEKKGDRES